MTIATSAASLSPGPFTITPVSCGPYTPAEQAQFGTTAAGGLVYKYANDSQTLTGAANLDVEFAEGSTVVTENDTGSMPDTQPGQDAEWAVDAVGGSGQNVTFNSCTLVWYSVETPTAPAAAEYRP